MMDVLSHLPMNKHAIRSSAVLKSSQYHKHSRRSASVPLYLSECIISSTFLAIERTYDTINSSRSEYVYLPCTRKLLPSENSFCLSSSRTST